MTMHAMSDVTGITISAENGGCGQPHEVILSEGGVRALECATCEAAIQGGHGHGWSTRPNGVLATPDEIAEQQRNERDAQVAGMRRLASWSAEAAGQQAPADFLAQMQAMQAAMLAQQAQIAELTARLTAPAAAPDAAGEVVVEVKAAPARKTAAKKTAPAAAG